jgi:hypothetical protein
MIRAQPTSGEDGRLRGHLLSERPAGPGPSTDTGVLPLTVLTDDTQSSSSALAFANGLAMPGSSLIGRRQTY